MNTTPVILEDSQIVDTIKEGAFVSALLSLFLLLISIALFAVEKIGPGIFAGLLIVYLCSLIATIILLRHQSHPQALIRLVRQHPTVYRVIIPVLLTMVLLLVVSFTESETIILWTVMIMALMFIIACIFMCIRNRMISRRAAQPIPLK